MDKIEITPELLADIKAKAEKATPGPWCTCLTAEKVLGRKHPDWGCIYANVQSSKTGEILEGCQLAAVNQWLASEEEKDAAREKYFKEGIKTNPGLMGANAEYIAAANPAVILDLIEDYEGKQQALHGMFLLVDQLKDCLNLEADVSVEGTIQGAISRINNLNAQLSKEANWLAEVICKKHSDIRRNGFVPDCPTGEKCDNQCVQCWRKAATKAVASMDMEK